MITLMKARTLRVDLTDVDFDDVEGDLRLELLEDPNCPSSTWTQTKTQMLQVVVNRYLREKRALLRPTVYTFRLYEWHSIPVRVTASVKK